MARWKPELGERYFYVGGGGLVNFNYWENDEADHFYYNFGNMFQTEEQAEQALKRVKETLLNFHKEIDNG
jgi:hypothetical protein